MSVKAALIGTGRIAHEHLSCLKQLPGVEIVAVCDRFAAVAEMTADRFGIPAWFSDHRRMLETARPDIVHITTPVTSHFSLALDALDAGCHVFVEKPITADYKEFLVLKARAQQYRRVLIEDHNFVFNEPIQRILALVRSGEFGGVEHIDVFYTASILEAWSPFADPNLSHPALTLPGGPISDFLPHLCSLAYKFVGPHLKVYTLWQKRATESPFPSDEFRALVEAEYGTACLGFSAHSQPNSIWVRVYGTKMQAEANLMEPRWNVDRVRPIHPGLQPVRNQLQEAWDIAKSAARSFRHRLEGKPLSNQGMWELLRRTYESIQSGSEAPVTLAEVDAVSRLVRDLTCKESAT